MNNEEGECALADQSKQLVSLQFIVIESKSQLQSCDHRDKIAALTFRLALSFCLSSSLIRVIVVDAHRFYFVCIEKT